MTEIIFEDNNNKLRRITEYTMGEWNGEKWVTVQDYSGDESWEGFTDEEFLEYLAGKPWPGSIETRRWDYDNPFDEYEPEDDDDR